MQFAKIEPTTDICIRLFIFSHINKKSVAFRELYDELNIERLIKNRDQESSYVFCVDLEDELGMVV